MGESEFFYILRLVSLVSVGAGVWALLISDRMRATRLDRLRGEALRRLGLLCILLGGAALILLLDLC